MKRRALLLLLILFSLLLFIASVRQGTKLDAFQRQIFGLYQSAKTQVAAASAFEALEKNASGEGNGLSALWWKEKGKEEIVSAELGKGYTVPVLAVCGRTDLLFPWIMTRQASAFWGAVRPRNSLGRPKSKGWPSATRGRPIR